MRKNQLIETIRQELDQTAGQSSYFLRQFPESNFKRNAYYDIPHPIDEQLKRLMENMTHIATGYAHRSREFGDYKGFHRESHVKFKKR